MAYNPAVRVCAPASIPPIAGVMPAPTVAYELFLTILTIVKVVDYPAHRTESAVPMLVSLALRHSASELLTVR
jgi:hypothetical protein